MDFSLILAGLVAKYPVAGSVLLVLGVLVILAQVYIAATPTQDDDKWYAKIEAVPVIGHLLAAIKSFAPIQRKEK